MRTLTWRTDAASGEIQATSAEAALTQLIAEGEWAIVDSARERRDIRDGAWIAIRDEAGLDLISRDTSTLEG